MKVIELIQLLQAENPDAIVVMGKDAEGNSHSPLSSIWAGAYEAETTWSGNVGYLALTEDLISEGYSEEDVLDNGEAAVVLCPTS